MIRGSTTSSRRSLARATKAQEEESSWKAVWSALFTLILLCSVAAVVLYLMRWMSGGSGSPLTFGRSRAKLYAQKDIKITFHDVAGIDEAVAELREVVDFLEDAGEVSGSGRPHSQGRAAGRAAGNGQDAAGQGGRRRSGRAVFQPQRLRLRRNVRRRRGGPRARSVRPGREQGSLHHLHRRARRPGQDARRRPSSAATTNANRRSTSCSSRWTASTPIAASSSWPRPTGPKRSIRPCCGRAASIAPWSSIGPTSMAAKRSSRSMSATSNWAPTWTCAASPA